MAIRIQRKAGFTLLELLVVIAVISFLMAALFVGLSKLRSRTQAGQARNLVEKLQSALETYHLKFRAYPAPTNALLYDIPTMTAAYTFADLEKNNEELYYYLATQFKKGANTARGEVEAAVTGGPFITGGLNDRETMTRSGKTYIVDPWHNLVVYKVERREYPDPLDATLKIKADIPVLYSFGINGKDNGGVEDDISVSVQ